ncbi:MAG: TonB-dependent receptor family protein [Prevotella sp.]|nr:TonB-dependent receptor family protein [Prevotella sp.]
MARRVLLLLVFLVLVVAHGNAQRVSVTFNNVSLSDALIRLNKLSKQYDISFIYDELEDFTVTAEIKDMTVPQAIRQLIGFYPVRAVMGKNNEIFVECTQKAPNRLIGRLIDEAKNPVPYANILLLSPTDSTYITAGVSNANGAFVIPCRQIDVVARISCIGYKTLKLRVNVTNVGDITMHEETQNLNSITVKGKRPIITHTENRTVFHTSEMNLKAGLTATELLKYLPRVIVRSDGTVLYSGTLATLYVNERRLDASRSGAYLHDLAASDIERIELQETNSGENDANTPGGIIYIYTKNKLGIDGSVRMEARKMHKNDFTLQPGVNLYFGNPRWNIYGTYDFSRSLLHRNDETTNTYLNTVTENGQPTKGNERHNALTNDECITDGAHNFKIGTMVQLDRNGRQTIGAETNGSREVHHGDAQSNLNFTGHSHEPWIGSSKQKDNAYTDFFNAATSYKYVFDDRNSFIRLLLNYNYKHSSINNLLNTEYDPRTHYDMMEYNGANTNTNNVSAVFDLRKNFSNQWSLRAGASYEISRRKHTQERLYGDSKVMDTDSTSTSIKEEPRVKWSWKTNEDIAAIYAGASHQWPNRLFALATMRMEYSLVDGYDPMSDLRNYEHRRFDPIPYLYLSYKTENRASYDLTYTRSIVRPTFTQLAQYRIRRSDVMVDCGNTALDCQTTDRVRISSDFGPHSVSASYNYTNGCIIDDHIVIDGLTYRMNTNNSVANQWTLDYAFTGKPASWWQTNWYVQGQYTYLPQSQNRKKKLSGLFSTNNEFAAGRWTYFTLEFLATTPTIYGNAYMKGTWRTDIALRQSLWNDALSLKLSVQDVFNSFKTDIHVKNADLDYHSVIKNPTQLIMATLTWNFNNKHRVRNEQIDNPNETKKRM